MIRTYSLSSSLLVGQLLSGSVKQRFTMVVRSISTSLTSTTDSQCLQIVRQRTRTLSGPRFLRLDGFGFRAANGNSSVIDTLDYHGGYVLTGTLRRSDQTLRHERCQEDPKRTKLRVFQVLTAVDHSRKQGRGTVSSRHHFHPPAPPPRT